MSSGAEQDERASDVAASESAGWQYESAPHGGRYPDVNQWWWPCHKEAKSDA